MKEVYVTDSIDKMLKVRETLNEKNIKNTIRVMPLHGQRRFGSVLAPVGLLHYLNSTNLYYVYVNRKDYESAKQYI